MSRLEKAPPPPKFDKTQNPEGLIITISKGMIGSNGYRHWLRNFLAAMKKSEEVEDHAYWFRQGNMPKSESEIKYVYLVIGNRVRFRVFYAGARGACTMQFENRPDPLFGKAWILAGGPVSRPAQPYPMKGFQGFRYCAKLF